MQGISIPRYARAARFDYDSKRVPCTPGTRTETLDTIYHWFNGQISETGQTLLTEGNPKGRIFWLDGVAGKGENIIFPQPGAHLKKKQNIRARLFFSLDPGPGIHIDVL